MQRKVDAQAPLETIEDELLFTDAMLEVDPGAASLRGFQKALWEELDATRGADRALRQRAASVDAGRVYWNRELDVATLGFGEALLSSVGRDREHPRFTAFFSVAPSVFVKQGLLKQVQATRGWLVNSTDPVLLSHKPALEAAAAGADQALLDTDGVDHRRVEQWERRRVLVENLNRMRDALHLALSQIAQAEGRGREWVASFFRRGD